MKILFVCSMGRLRSRTAHHYFIGPSRFGGTDSDADVKICKEDLEWADSIVCMEMRHRSKLRRRYKGFSGKMVVWNIPDVFPYMDDELLFKLEEHFGRLGYGSTYYYYD